MSHSNNYACAYPPGRRHRQSWRSRPAPGWTLLFVALSAQSAPAAEPADKRQYHLFNPTPREFMRELSADRPDKTESAYTVDAGHFQIESDLLSYSSDHDTTDGGDTRVEAWGIASLNIKAGLLNWLDLQLVLDTYNHVTTEDRTAGTKVRQSGLGDFATRVKMNLWGNDEGRSALSAMPFVKFPTNQDDLGNDDVEGGIIFPFALELPAGWGLGAQTEFDIVRNRADDGYAVDFVNTITFSRNIVGNLGGYVEFFSLVSSESDSAWIGTFDLGLTYRFSADVQLDAGVNIGVTDSAEDVNPFLGLTWRF